jgi:pyruvate formate lyase activating enzyme
MTYNKETCVECDACIQTCPYDSTPKAMTISPTDLASQIISYKDFIDGVTFSGGECMLQANEIKEVVELLKPYNIKVFIDSNATFDIDSNRELIDLVDGFMLDIKAIDKDISKELTGYEYDFINTVIQINKLNKLLELRVVDCNDLESKKVIAWIDCFIKNNPSVNKRINKLATKPLKEDKVIKLNDFIRKHS